jgi:hypothetical protein
MVAIRRVSLVTPGNRTFLGSQPGRCQIKERTGPLGADPGTGIEETHQGKSSPTIRKLFVAVVLTDFLCMVTALVWIRSA